MEIEAYKIERSRRRKHVYEFISRGKVAILKVVEFQATNEFEVYNLAMADIINGKINYINVSDNKDTDRIMQTVAEIILSFTREDPERIIFATGSTPARTRLYQRYLSRNVKQVQEIFAVAGLKVDGTGFEIFTKGKNYNGFLFKRL